MFDDFYGLTGRPFQLTPDPTFYFESATHRKALSYLGYGMAQGEGFIVITGEVGSGKSTLVAHLMKKIDPAQMTVAQIVTSNLDGDEMIHVTAQAFGLEVEGHDKASALGAIEGFLHEEAREGRRCLLIVDEAQNLSIEALEELRMLSNFQLGSHPLLQTLLLGQPEFREVLATHADLEQLRQRVIAAHHLDAMNATEVRPYIEHRLECVGWNGNPAFDQRVFAELHQATGGIPRRVNQVMTRLMLLGAVEQRTRIDSAMLNAVLNEMQSDATFLTTGSNPLGKEKTAPSSGSVKHATTHEGIAGDHMSGLRDRQIEELQYAVLELAEAKEEYSQLPSDLNDRLTDLELRMNEQDQAVRQVLTLLIEWFEDGAERKAA